MIEVGIPASPIEVSGWTPPTDPDLKWVSLLNYTVARLLEDLRLQGFKFRQIEESDAQNMIDSANSQISASVAAFTGLYEGPG